MFVSIAKGLGRLALWGAATALLVAASFFLIGSYFVTWPVLRKSPREQHLSAAINLAASMMTMMATMRNSEGQDESQTPVGPADIPVDEGTGV